jgi:hypothetical protein
VRPAGELLPLGSGLSSLLNLGAAAMGLAYFVFLSAAFESFLQPIYNEVAKTAFVAGGRGGVGFLLAAACVGAAALSLGRDTARPGTLLAAVHFVFVFVPIAVYSSAFPFQAEGVWPLALLTACMIALGVAGRIRIGLRPPAVAGRASVGPVVQAGLVVAFAATLAACAYGVVFHGNFGAIDDVVGRRTGVQLPMVVRYALQWHHFLLAPLCFALAVRSGRYALAGLVLVTYFPWFFVSTFRYSLLLPGFLFGFAVFAAVFARRSLGSAHVIGYALAILTPLLLGAQFAYLRGEWWIPGIFMIYRGLALPGFSFFAYEHFFASNAHLLFSHVTGVDAFVPYPYPDVIPNVLAGVFHHGSLNANFWAQDGMASLGWAGVPVITALHCGVLIALNTAAQGLGARFLALCCLLVAIRMNDGTLFTTLFSGGLGFLVVILALLPRIPSDAPVSDGRSARPARTP